MASAVEVARDVSIIEVIKLYAPSAVLPYNINDNMPCPFHKDKTPSFHIYQKTNSFFCFSCGVGGSPIDFVMHMTGLSDALQAAETICDDFRLEYDKEPVSAGDSEYYAVYKYAESLFVLANKKYTLADGTQPIEYWRKRGLESVVEKYGLGFCPPAFLDKSRSVVPFSRIIHKKFPKVDTFSLGLTDKSGYCLFSDRFIFPIRDYRGRTIAFSGRARESGVPAKYKNTPETEKFKKRGVLYNWDVAKGYNDVVVVEGYADALSLIVCGFPNVVAAMGTAFTEEHLELLKDKNILLAFDNDDAGIKKSAKFVWEHLDRVLHCLRVGALGEYKDFNDVLCGRGGSAMVKDCLSKKSKVFGLDYLLGYCKHMYDLSDVYDRTEVFEKMTGYLANNAYSEVVNDYVCKHLLRLLGIK